MVFADMRMVLAYQPILGSVEEGMRDYRRALEIQVALREHIKPVNGGDIDVNLRRQDARQKICGKFWVVRMKLDREESDPPV